MLSPSGSDSDFEENEEYLKMQDKVREKMNKEKKRLQKTQRKQVKKVKKTPRNVSIVGSCASNNNKENLSPVNVSVGGSASGSLSLDAMSAMSATSRRGEESLSVTSSGGLPVHQEELQEQEDFSQPALLPVDEAGGAGNNLGGDPSRNGGGGGAGGSGGEVEFKTYEDLSTAILNLEVTTRMTYSRVFGVRRRQGNNSINLAFENNNFNLETYISTLDSIDKFQLKWYFNANNSSCVPCVFLSTCIYSCHQGVDLNKKKNDKRKEKYQQGIIGAANVGEHFQFKTRKLNQPTKKAGCPAQFSVKKIIVFPEYEIAKDSSDRHKRNTMKRLRSDLQKLKSSSLILANQVSPLDGNAPLGGGGGSPLDLNAPSVLTNSLSCSLLYVTKFPALSDHKFHHTGIAAGIGEKTDKRVVEYIKKLAREGKRNKTEIDSLVTHFVKNDLQFDGDIMLRARFLPSHSVVRNIIQSVKSATRYSRYDLENVVQLKANWEKSGKVKYIPKGAQEAIETILDRLEQNGNGGDGEWDDMDDIDHLILNDPVAQKLCLVYQSYDMQRLYRLYGHRLILLDATHKVCKYSIPLFLLVVQANVNFQVAAVIILEDEGSDLLQKALEIIKEWNPEVVPKYGMIDFDTGEILALETVFPGIKLFLCDFHREQSWTRWVNKGKNKVTHIAEEVKARFRRIANAFTEAEVAESIQSLRNWEHFPGSVQTYFESTWFPELEKWCIFYRPNDLFRCNTNNGTERLNESLKYDELKKNYNNCTLSELMTKLVDGFLPNLYRKYVVLNVKYSNLHKPYHSDLPNFLWNRPGPLVDHMRERYMRVSDEMARSVQPICVTLTKTFAVESINERTYERNYRTVEFGDERNMCWCNCEDFRRHRLICKHFFAVIRSGKAVFDDISPIFREDIYTNIDEFVLGEGLDLTSPTVNSDEQPSTMVVDLSASLPGPSKTSKTKFKSKKDFLLNKMKVLNEKIWNVKKSASLDLLLPKVTEAIALLEEAEDNGGELTQNCSAHEDGGLEELITPHENNGTTPARRYDIIQKDIHVYNPSNDIQIYNPRLPKSKIRKHPYSGRHGAVADVMKAQFKVNVPIAKDTQPGNVIVDGTVDIDNTDMDVLNLMALNEDDETVEDEMALDEVDQVDVNNQEDNIVDFSMQRVVRPSQASEEVTIEVIEEKGVKFKSTMEIEKEEFEF